VLYFTLPDMHLWSLSRDGHDDNKTALGVARKAIHRFIWKYSLLHEYRKASKRLNVTSLTTIKTVWPSLSPFSRNTQILNNICWFHSPKKALFYF